MVQYNSHMSAWDVRLFYLINHSYANPFFDWLMPALSAANKSLWFWIPVVAILVWVFARSGARARWMVIGLAISIALANEACDVLKTATHLPRPPSSLPDVRLPSGLTAQTSNGFPSAHAANMAALACFAFLAFNRWALLALPPAIAVGFSRVYNGAHFPSQVIGGYAVGVCVAWVVYAFCNRWTVRLRACCPSKGEGRIPVDESVPKSRGY